MTLDPQARQPISERDETISNSSKLIVSDLEFRQLEKQLHQTEAELLWHRKLYDTTPHFYFTINSQGILLSINRSGADRLGYAAQELSETSIFNLFHAGDRPIFNTAITALNSAT